MHFTACYSPKGAGSAQRNIEGDKTPNFDGFDPEKFGFFFCRECQSEERPYCEIAPSFASFPILKSRRSNWPRTIS
jgi:hypothetical protein